MAPTATEAGSTPISRANDPRADSVASCQCSQLVRPVRQSSSAACSASHAGLGGNPKLAVLRYVPAGSQSILDVGDGSSHLAILQATGIARDRDGRRRSSNPASLDSSAWRQTGSGGARPRRRSQTFPSPESPIPAVVVHWLGRIKAAAARANADLGLLDAELAGRIAAAGDRVAAGEFDDQFPIDVFQTGSGTSSNTNANEVIARSRARASTRTTTSTWASRRTTCSRPPCISRRSTSRQRPAARPRAARRRRSRGRPPSSTTSSSRAART